MKTTIINVEDFVGAIEDAFDDIEKARSTLQHGMTTVWNMTEITGESVIYVETQGVVVKIEAYTMPNIAAAA